MNSLANDLSLLGASTQNYFTQSHKMLINGKFVNAVSNREIDVYDPTTSQIIARVPEGGAEDIDKAVLAARNAFDNGPWPKMTPVERERRLLKLADLLEHHGQEISEIESVNTGRILSATRKFDVDLSVDYLRYTAGWATKIEGKTMSPSVPYLPDGKFFAYTTREPVGVVAAITPWNVPLGQAIWKIAPAIATGCTVILKPAEQAPLSALRFAQLVELADIPPGVINIVSGIGRIAGAALVNHPAIDKISFTGSTETGVEIAQVAARNMKKVTLELGGKSPVIVMDDADLDVVIPGAAWAIYGNHGQNCCAGSRLYVHKKLFDKVVSGIADIARNIRLGAALDSATEMGPLISKVQQNRVLNYINAGRSQGAEILTGGESPDHPGSFVKPTVLVKTDLSMSVVQEEIFGPVLCAMPYDDIEGVIQEANATKFGLGASLWTNNINNVHNISPRLDAGTVWVNTHNVLDLSVPFGGMKFSGTGHELGDEAVLQHTRLKVNMISIT